MKNGKPMFTYNYLGLSKNTVASTTSLKGKVTLVYNFVYDGGGLGKGGMLTISADGKKIAEGRIDKTQGMIFSADEGTDVGMDEGTAVGDYPVPFAFSGGKVIKINVTVKPEGGSGTTAKKVFDDYVNV